MPTTSSKTSCEVCKDVIERPDMPHVIRKCSGCGRELRVVEPGKYGRGLNIQVIPGEWIRKSLNMSLNPLKNTGRLFKHGIEWIAKKLFIGELPAQEEVFWEEALKLEQYTDNELNNFPPLHGLDINEPKDAEQILTIISEHQSTREFWALWTGHFLAVAREARNNSNLDRAVWAIACAERCRSMMKFKEELEEAVWMGHSVSRVIDILKIWEAHKKNSAEEFWQLTFNENSYVLSQVFAMPVVFIKDKAYLGGTKIDRHEGRFIDYLFSAESSQEAVLIEIKTPTTKLLGSKYRGHYPPSKNLSGTIVQVLNYRTELIKDLRRLIEETDYHFTAFNPKCIVIIGNANEELKDVQSRKSFEIFRNSLKDVEIITYDELFRKVEILAELFGLKKKTDN